MSSVDIRYIRNFYLTCRHLLFIYIRIKMNERRNVKRDTKMQKIIAAFFIANVVVVAVVVAMTDVII